MIGQDQKGGIGRPILQQFQQGVLSVAVHGQIQDVYLAPAFVGAYIGVLPELTGGVHLDLLALRRQKTLDGDDVRMNALGNLLAAGTQTAGTVHRLRLLTDQRLG